MNYQGDSMQVPALTFGINAAGPGPTYDARVVAQRGVTLAGDDPDATINAVAPIEGDFNGDAVIDAADYVVWRNGLGSTHTPEQYALWRARFGMSFGSGSIASDTVPEPTAIVLSWLGVLPALAHRRKRVS